MRTVTMHAIVFMLSAVMVLQCASSTVIRQGDDDKTSTINYAGKTGTPVAYMSFLEKVEFKEVIVNRKNSNLYVVDKKTNREDSLNPINVKYIFVINPGYINKINYQTSGGAYPLEFFIKNVNGAAMATGSKINAEVLLTDNTRILGKIAGINFANGDITIQSKLRDFNLTKKVIREIKMSMNEVKLILIDGTERRGGIIRDDGNEIVIRTILGDESYQRRKIHKIVYHE
jgi:hypothetical protein